MIDNFNESWCTELTRGWFVGFAWGRIMHNGQLESTNKVVKDEYTLRNLFHLLPFVEKMMEFLRDESMRRNPQDSNYKPVSFSPSVGTKLWKKAMVWARTRREQGLKRSPRTATLL